jgi:hypothetical protein
LKSCGVIGVFRSQTRLEVPAPFATLFLLHISYPKVDWRGLFVSLFRFEQFWGWYLDNGVLHNVGGRDISKRNK